MNSIARVDFTRRYCFPIISDILNAAYLYAPFQVVVEKHGSATSTDFSPNFPLSHSLSGSFFCMSSSENDRQKKLILNLAFRACKLKPANSRAYAPKSAGHSSCHGKTHACKRLISCLTPQPSTSPSSGVIAAWKSCSKSPIPS